MVGDQSRPVPFADVVSPEAWAHVIVKKYLEGIKYCVPQREVLDDRSISPLDRVESWHVGYDELLLRMEELLPSEYRGKADAVSPNSMGSARIEVGADGKVPWDKIWTSFCDLALAGGPPHRGKLLEAVTSEECASKMESYESVVAEIERGIQIVTGLTTVRSESLGWVGVECDDQQMAAWMMRAIIVENVMVRRQGSVIYLPAGPEFQLTKEIKNVITSVAKTVHYWRDH
jgi:sirohydrochlorin cobaltochelatase